MTRKIYALDCETDPFLIGRIPQPFLWGLWDGETYEEFQDANHVVLRLSGERAVVYAHNGGRFDYHYLREYINTDENIMLIGGRLARFRIGECEFRDSMNLFTFPLSAYQKEKIDYSLMEAGAREDPNNRATISRYLRSDCVNLFDLVTAFFKDYGRNLTQAGAAMRTWSRMSGITPPKQTAIQYERYKPFYFGGRVQCFNSGHVCESFSVLDINSAYPYAMLSAHPFSVDGELLKHLPVDSDLPRCFVRFEGVSQGALPWIEEVGAQRKLRFPDDEKIREYCVTGWELQAALETDSVRIHLIKDCYYFHETITFTDYVQRFFALKRDAKTRGDKAQELFAKIFLNALYGKFGANPQNYREYRLSHPEGLNDYAEEGWTENAQWGERYLIERELPDLKQRRYNLATAASITGYVRAQLWRSIKACSGVLYCDTDSIAARDVSGLTLGDGLGQWKREMLCNEYAIAGKKLYAFRKTPEWLEQERKNNPLSEIKEWKTACKGAQLTPEELVRIAQGHIVTYRPQVPTYSIHRSEPTFINRDVRMTA